MKNFLSFSSRISVTLFAGLLFALLISSALAATTPTCTPGSSGCTVTPTFSTLLIGSGTNPSTTGDAKVSGTLYTVGGLSTDDLNSYTSGGTIDSTAQINASAFGNLYIKASSSTTNASGIYSAKASCAAADKILGCTGYLSSPTSSTYFYGAQITKTGTIVTYSCTAKANTSGVVANAVCWSPDGGSTSSDI